MIQFEAKILRYHSNKIQPWAFGELKVGASMINKYINHSSKEICSEKWRYLSYMIIPVDWRVHISV